jgi:putative photosynthetic complex assembly protein
MAVMTPEERLRERDREMIPKTLLRGMLALVVACLLIVTYARVTDRPLEAMPPQGMAIVAERALVIEGSMTGAARVLDTSGALIAEFTVDKGGFVAGIYRVLERVRGQQGLPNDLPVRLVAWEDGRLSLLDDATGWRAELTGFGADNLATFARLLD